jgi:rod shape-determining protein MreC
LVLTAVTLLALDLPGTGPLDPVRNLFAGIFRPIRSGGDALFSPISNGWKGAFGYGDVKDDNDRLRAELDRLDSQDAELVRLRKEVADLKKILGVKAGDVPTQTAEVVSGPISPFDQSIEIDQGSGDGIKKGMAVITGGGVLGRVTSVTGGRSKVELLTEPSFQLGIRLEGRERGVIQGRGQGKDLVVEGVGDEQTEVEEGDFVYTSGIDQSAFPKDLKVGRVVSVRDSGTGSKVLEVEPLADLSSVYVKVVLQDPPR